MAKKYFGIDCSGKTIGVSCIQLNDDQSMRFIGTEYFQPKQDDLFEDLSFIANSIKALLNKYKPDVIAIEQIIQFMKGHSTAATITKLAGVNRLVCYICYEYLQTIGASKPDLLNVLKVRHSIKLSKELPKKEDIPSIIEQRLNISFPYVYKTRGKTKGQIDEISYDLSDACGVALAKIIIDNPPPKPIKIKKSKVALEKIVINNPTPKSIKKSKNEVK